MQSSEKHLLVHTIQALIKVASSIKETEISKLTSRAPSKKDDSLFLDVLPENLIRSHLIDKYDRNLVLVTEETGEYNFNEISNAEIVAFSDPTDRSKQLKLFLNHMQNKFENNPGILFGQAEAQVDLIEEWENMFGTPASINGACCSISIVKRSEILFSVIYNYITNEVFIACEDFIGFTDIEELQNADGRYNFSDFTALAFPFKSNSEKSFVTYTGKELYVNCLKRANIIPNTYRQIETEPGGPLRILFMTDLLDSPVHFILSNGEKIGEWLGWLAFCKYSSQLNVHSVFPESDFSQKDNILMYPSPPYSILEVRDKKLFLNYDKLIYFNNPSRYRELIFITHKDDAFLRATIEVAQSRCLILN